MTEELPEADSHWSHTLLAEHLHAEVGISPTQTSRIVADLDLTPHRIRRWLTTPKDPEFFTKATAVCAFSVHGANSTTAATARCR